MRLHDDLKVLANAAPPPPDPQVLLLRARSIKHRRTVIVPAAAVMVVLVLTITYLSRVDSGGPTTTLAFRLEPPPDPHMVVQPVPANGRQLEHLRDIMQARAELAQLGHAHAWVDGDRVLLEFDATSVSVDLQQLAAPGRLELRKVLDSTTGHGGVLPPDRPQGKEASTLDELIAKIGPETWARVSALDAVSGELFKVFAGLTAAEVRLLPTRMKFYVATIGCEQLSADPAVPAPGPDEEVTACLMPDEDKLLLDRAAMSGADVADARFVEVKRPEGFTSFEVRLRLTKAGLARWTDLTSRVALREGCSPRPGDAHCRLSFAVDGKVYSVPTILRGLRADEAVITGFYTEEEARMVAARIGPRELPPGVQLDR